MGFTDNVENQKRVLGLLRASLKVVKQRRYTKGRKDCEGGSPFSHDDPGHDARMTEYCRRAAGRIPLFAEE